MTDIVERLRLAGLKHGFAIILKQHTDEAADEIDRLRQERVRWRVDNEKMSADNDRLRAIVNDQAEAIVQLDAELHRALEHKP